MAGCRVGTCHPSYAEELKQEDHSPGQRGVKQDPMSKISNAERAGRVAQEVEHLPGKREAMSTHFSITKIKKGSQILLWLPFPQ
jgi:hypothetical protein